MQVTRKSQLTGKENTMEIPIDAAKLTAIENRGRRNIQDVAPELTDEQREFFITGATPEEWASLFPPEIEDDDEAEDAGWPDVAESGLPV